MKIAFVGLGQSYASHVWMGRMREMLNDQIVVNIDDSRSIDRDAVLANGTRYVPRKMNRWGRALRLLKLNRQTDSQMRSEWMLRTIQKSDASLVFVHFLDFAVQFRDAWSRLDIPVVVHCHGYDITWDVQHTTKKTPLHSPHYQSDVRSLADNVWFIANSTHTRRQLEKININPRKIFLKRFGVPLADRPRAVCDGPPQILFLGRLVDFKGPIETAKAFAQVVHQHVDATLHFAGSGVLENELDETIDQLNLRSRTIRHGCVSAQRGHELRQQSCIFTAHNQTGVTTRQVEAFGVSLLEAMGEGIPVVTGRSGGIPDFVHHDVNGLLFEPGDIEAHASMLNELLSSKQRRQSLGEAAWQTVRDSYQPSHEADDLNHIFATVSKLQYDSTVTSERHKSAARRAA
jgi:glycosyltransferase involved in cell wall biosynthesis